MAYFGSDHGEAATLFASTGRLDGSVQGQNVSLEGDAVDYSYNVVDLAGRSIDGSHLNNRLRNYGTTLPRCVEGAQSQTVGLLRMLGVLPCTLCQLMHRCSRASEFLDLLPATY